MEKSDDEYFEFLVSGQYFKLKKSEFARKRDSNGDFFGQENFFHLIQYTPHLIEKNDKGMIILDVNANVFQLAVSICRGFVGELDELILDQFSLESLFVLQSEIGFYQLDPIWTEKMDHVIKKYTLLRLQHEINSDNTIEHESFKFHKLVKIQSGSSIQYVHRDFARDGKKTYQIVPMILMSPLSKLTLSNGYFMLFGKDWCFGIMNEKADKCLFFSYSGMRSPPFLVFSHTGMKIDVNLPFDNHSMNHAYIFFDFSQNEVIAVDCWGKRHSIFPGLQLDTKENWVMGPAILPGQTYSQPEKSQIDKFHDTFTKKMVDTHCLTDDIRFFIAGRIYPMIEMLPFCYRNYLHEQMKMLINNEIIQRQWKNLKIIFEKYQFPIDLSEYRTEWLAMCCNQYLESLKIMINEIRYAEKNDDDVSDDEGTYLEGSRRYHHSKEKVLKIVETMDFTPMPLEFFPLVLPPSAVTEKFLRYPMKRKRDESEPYARDRMITFWNESIEMALKRKK